jgi:hypothetical protein
MLKSPHTSFRIYNTNKVTSDGESLDCFRQRDPGLFHLVKDLYLDQLAVGGGDGTGVDLLQDLPTLRPTLLRRARPPTS